MVRSINGRLRGGPPVIQLYNERLANTVGLRLQGKTAKWTRKDATSVVLDELLDQLSEDVEEYLDLFADRVVHWGGSTRGVVSTWSHFLRAMRLAQTRAVMSMVAVAHPSRLAN